MELDFSLSTALDSSLSEHARSRMQQRGIRAEALEALLDHGRESFDHRGGVLLYLDKPARRKLAGSRRANEVRRIAGIFAVIASDGNVVTVGHRYKRIAHR